MKRQRIVDGQNAKAGKAEGGKATNTTMTAGVKKKTKNTVEKVEEDRKSTTGAESSSPWQEDFLGLENQQPCVWSVVDEQMSWGSIWLPIWDVEYMGEANHNNMFNDVVWDDDLWNLKGINTIPGNGKEGV